METQTRADKSKSAIIAWFEKRPERAFRHSDFSSIHEIHRELRHIDQDMNMDEFVVFLLDKTPLKKHSLKFPGLPIAIYLWGRDFSSYETAYKIGGAGAYLSHYTAAFLHELTDQVPKTTYVTAPQPRKRQENIVLTQQQIDQAFSRPARVTKAIVTLGGHRIARLTGMVSDGLGVVEMAAPGGAKIFATSLERTLLDMVVRPIYAGGPQQVLEAFRLAKGRMSTNKLIANYKKMGYVYPYHQAIGFYMERAGVYSENTLRMLREIERRRDFYLMHGMKETEYVSEWRLFIPKGF
ncbi:MAG: hypothetical protein C4523_08360 [Myxococcales bacterium]|nr:MAG: hypothetical protein C4523_08360 [Myxococcales bacterium]